MNRIFKILVSVVIFVSSVVYADPKSNLQNQLQKYGALSANFSQVVTRKNGDVVSKSSGMLALKKPDSLMLHTTDPDEQVLFTRGKDVLFYDPFVNQVSIFDAKSLYSSPFLLLTSSSEKVWSQYDVEQNGSSYTLKPKSGGEVTSISVAFSGDTLNKLSITMKDGNVNNYSFSSVNYTVNASVFNYEIPQDAQVDDERKSN